MMMLYEKIIASPVGKLRLVACDKGLRYLAFKNDIGKHAALEGELQPSTTHKFLLAAEKQLGEYFAGKRNNFDLPLDMQGTIFQQKAWRALLEIPHGETRSYKEQATLVGDANKARAVGMANNRNPISIIVPCHRVIGADGGLTGYGGGMKRKAWLLEFERKTLADAA